MRQLPGISSFALLTMLLLICGCQGKPSSKPTRVVKKLATPTIEKSSSPAGAATPPVRIAEKAPPPKLEAAAQVAPQPMPAPQKLVRPSVLRREFNEPQLAKAGIRRYESKHLRLFTDIPAERAQPIPPLVDAVYGEWEQYFGALPPDHEGSTFQITGYVMADPQKFRDLGLVPADLPPFIQGRHRGAEFWMFDQATDYYRRHLVLHESTHSYMAFLPQVPLEAVWYLEGIAELFGTHAMDAHGKNRCRVVPAHKAGFANWGRTEIIREEIKAGRGMDLPGVLRLRSTDFLQNASYGWAWGLCQFLDQHPRYRDPFHHFVQEARQRHAAEDFKRLFSPNLQDLNEEWLLYSAAVDYGYDVERAAISFRNGQPLTDALIGLEIAANRGWQSSGVHVLRGKTYRLVANGRCTMAQLPVAWESEPQGISIRYAHQRPVGMLIGSIRADAAPANYPQTTMLQTFAVGRELLLKPDVDGTLYLRVNDFWSELADNSGKYRVEIQLATAP